MLLILVTIANIQFSRVQRADSDAEKTKATATNYAQGWCSRDANRLGKSFNSELAKRLQITDEKSRKSILENMGAPSLVQATRRRNRTESTDKQVIYVAVLDIVGTAAIAKLKRKNWVDYMHLSKVNGQWKIVNVLWELASADEQKQSFIY